MLGGVLRWLPLLGLVLYVTVRLSYVIYYGQFGLTPEEVGLGYGDILARAAYYLLYLVVVDAVILPIFAVFLFPFYGPVLYAARRGVGALRRRWGGTPATLRPLREQITRGLVLRIYVVVLVASLLVGLPWLGYSSARATLANRDEFAGGEFGDIAGPGFEMRLVHASATGEGVGVESFRNGGCYLLISSAGGVYALYDPRERIVLRIPVGAVALVSPAARRTTCPD